MSPFESDRIKPALVLGAIIFVIALVLLVWLGDYGGIAALFLALLLALLTTIVIYLAWGLGDAPEHGAHASGAKPASASAASDGAAQEAEAEAARKAEA